MEELKKEEEKIKKKIIEMTGNDKTAVITEWKSLRKGGIIFNASKLEKIGEDFINIKPSLGFKIVIGFIMLVLIMNSWTLISDKKYYIGIGLIIFGIIAWFVFLKDMFKTKIFNKLEGFYYEGNYSESEVKINLSEVYALQILKEKMGNKQKSGYSYEINMILKDGKRQNVIDHGNLKKVKENAQIIAEFLNIPVWDTTDFDYEKLRFV